jgi:hypothetical protein
MVRDTPLGQAIFETMLGWVLLTIFVVVQFGIYLLIQRIAKIEV